MDVIQRVDFDEASTGTIEFDIVDEAGDAVPASNLTAATLSLYALDWVSPTGSPEGFGYINDRQDQNVLNANDVTIDSDGHVIWSVQPEDNAKPAGLSEKQDAAVEARQIWRHVALFRFAWSGGQFYRRIVEIDVTNLRSVV